MATLFDSASLALIPSGVKESKLYSIKPTNGDGDFTFSRGTDTATRVNASGLIEKERGNLALQSNQFDTTWALVTASVTGGQSGYDGSSDAWLLSKSGTYGRVEQSLSYTGILTFSVYVKSGTADYFELTNSSYGYAGFSLDDGIVVKTGAGVISPSVESVGGGWYRCSISCNVAATSTWRIIAGDVGADTATGTSGTIYIQDAQLEQGLVATDYIETTTAAVYEGITDNLPRLDYSGGASCPSLLLEPSRTNLIVHSEYFGAWTLSGDGAGQSITTNYATSPEGVANATRIQLDKTGGTYSRISISATGTSSGVSCVFSVYLKANSGSPFVYIQSGPNIGTAIELTSEWQRFTIIGNASGGTTSCIIAVADSVSGTTETADILAYGAQLESSASYVSSYIPTYGTSASRAADDCDIINEPSLMGQTEGTAYVEINHIQGIESLGVFMNDGSGSNYGYLVGGYISSGNIPVFVVNNNTAQVSIQGTTPLSSGTHKLAIAYKENDFAMYVDGVQIGTDSSGTLPALNDLYIGQYKDNVARNGNKKQVILFKTRLTNAELAALTA